MYMYMYMEESQIDDATMILIFIYLHEKGHLHLTVCRGYIFMVQIYESSFKCERSENLRLAKISCHTISYKEGGGAL